MEPVDFKESQPIQNLFDSLYTKEMARLVQHEAAPLETRLIDYQEAGQANFLTWFGG